MRASTFALLATLSIALPFAAPAAAQEGDDAMMPGAEETGGETGEDDTFLAGEKTEEEEMLAPPEQEADTGLAEDPETPYLSVGPRFRWLMVPSWFIGMFGVDILGADHLLASNVGIGAEFTYRKDDFDITAAIWWLGLSWDPPVSFKEKGEDANSWEVVENTMSTVLITGDFIWSSPITEWFAITYGAGIGFGIPIGELVRNEAYADSPRTPCPGETTEPNDGCEPDENYNEVYKIPTGIVPWLNFLFGMRFKPHRHVAIYVDSGFGIGFQLGLRGGYIF
jgi:hypothetical protein